jgi:PAS domain S-box-containing protein
MTELNKSDELFRALWESTPDALVMVDPQGRMVMVNRQAEVLFGYEKGELSGRQLETLLPERYRGAHGGHRAGYFAKPGSRPMSSALDLFALRKDGSEFAVEISLSTVKQGEEVFALSAIRDVTEYKRTESALAEKTFHVQLLQEVTVAANEAANLADAMPRVLDRICSSIGWPIGHVYQLAENSPEELVSKGVWYLKDPERFKTFREATEATRFSLGVGLPGRVLASKKPEWIPDVIEDANFPRARLGKDLGVRAGFAVPVSVGAETVAVLEFFSDKVIEPDGPLLGIMVQIGTQLGRLAERESSQKTQQIQMARARTLHEIETAILSTLDLPKMLELLFDKIDMLFPSTATGIRLIDPQSGEYNYIATRNLEIEDLTEALAKSGRALSDLVMESSAPLVIENLLQHPIPGLTEFLSKQGLISYLGLPLVVRDQTIGVFSIFTKGRRRFNNDDIEFFSMLSTQAAMAIHNSQLHKDLAYHARTLQSANSAKEEFLGFVSHELKTPLNLLNGYTGLIRDKALGEINDEQAAALTKMEGACQELLKMIDSLLQATSIEVGAGAVSRDEIGLSDFLRDLATAYALPQKKELTLHWKYSSALPVIKTDHDKLKHIVQNLINNAIKYTEKGRVTISAKIIEREALPSTVDSQPSAKSIHKASGSQPESPNAPLQAGSQKWVEFKVADTGVGIPRESLAVVFERFHQLGGNRKKSSGGIGLGLHIVKTFTERLGGEIHVESELGKGSVITVVVPAGI